ncbi:hypothetical protein B0H13DRAFT_2664021 [Mycena leptocephala]|nr:hypothetical protein B0H13DRAFT_2664021 [Mycena leptocephala]
MQIVPSRMGSRDTQSLMRLGIAGPHACALSAVTMSACSSPQAAAGRALCAPPPRGPAPPQAFHRAHSGSLLRTARVYTSRPARTHAFPASARALVTICKLATQTLLRQSSSSVPPSYPPVPCPASPRQILSSMRVRALRPAPLTRGKRARVRVTALASWSRGQSAHILSASTAHKPSPADERAHTRPHRLLLESRTREGKAAVKGARA